MSGNAKGAKGKGWPIAIPHNVPLSRDSATTKRSSDEQGGLPGEINLLSKCQWGDTRPERTVPSLLLRAAERNVLHTLLLALVTISGLRIRTAVSYGSITTIAAWKRGIAEHAARKAIAVTASGKGVRIGRQLIGPRALSDIYTHSILARR